MLDLDFEETKEYAEKGNAMAQFALGLKYHNGDEVVKNDVEAMNWYRLAAEQGYALAQHNIGWMYMYGKGVPVNTAKAVKWFTLAADQGYASAQDNLNRILCRQ